jgi:hypothetical protein
MREFLDILTQLNESTGLSGRKPGDVFRNPSGEEIVFNDIKFFPEGGGKYSPEELNLALQQIAQQADIRWQNNKSPRSGGFGLASFNGPDGEFFVGRYLESVKPSITDNYIPNQVGDYKFAGKAAQKSQAGLSPQDLLTNKVDLTIPSIMNQLAQSLGTDNPLYALAHQIATGVPLPLKFAAPKDLSFSAFRDYFCEILQPIALQKGQYTGQAGEAANRFLGGTFNNTLISFDDSKTAGLSDSILTNSEGGSVLVSSKGGKGATASAKNLLDKVDQLEKTNEGKKFLKKYTDIVELLREIKSQGQAGSPLYLGTKFNIISEKEADIIQNLKTAKPINIGNINSLSMLTPNLKKLAKERDTDNPDNVNLYYHLIAAIAHKAAEQVNEKTNFSDAAAAILNNGALIQMYTKAKESKDFWTLNEFDTVYPGASIKGVYLSASKTYYSTGIKGNFTFKIDKGQGKPAKEENTKVSLSFVDDLSTAAQQLTGTKSTKQIQPTRTKRNK